MGLYGVSTFGNRAFEMEKRDLDIAERIKEINTSLDSDDISQQERTQLFLEKNELENIVPYSEAAKIFVPAINAGLEIGSERLGSMRFVESLADMGKTLGRMNIRRALPAAVAQIPKGALIENAEELTNQLSVNLVDKLVLGENKSIFEGIDKEFFTKTSITALAIGVLGNKASDGCSCPDECFQRRWPSELGSLCSRNHALHQCVDYDAAADGGGSFPWQARP